MQLKNRVLKRKRETAKSLKKKKGMKEKAKAETYNRRDSLVVNHPTTDLPARD
jgi:hypothetical protein